MADLGTKLDLARSLFAPVPTQSTATVKGTVMADSSGGSVSVKIGEVEYDEDGNIIVPESDLIATIPIIGSATTGDEVTVIVEDGSPTAIAAPGWGDEIAAGVEKTQYITYVQSGTDAGLHIHEDASDYNTDGDLYLTSGGLAIRDSGVELATFSDSKIELGKNYDGYIPVIIDLFDGAGQISVQSISGTNWLDILSRYANIRAKATAQVIASGSASDPNARATLKAGDGTGAAAVSVFGNYQTPGYGIHPLTIRMDAEKMMVNLSDAIEVNQDAGTSGYALVSKGSGNPPIWAPRIPTSRTENFGSIIFYYGDPSDPTTETYTLNFKTINNNSIIGSGNISISGGSLPFCHAVNTSATGSINSTIKNVTLHSIDIQSADGSDYFELSNGGIKCKQAGKIEVNGSCYFGTATASWSRGVYLMNGSTQIGTNGYGSGYSTAVMACQAVVTVAAGDVIYLAARSSSSNTVAVNYATFLSIKYLEI